MEMIAKVRGRKGRLDLPIVSGKHLRRISDRTALQLVDNAEKFITTRQIDSFESLAKFTADREQRYQQLETVHLSKGQKLNRLKELSKMYALYAPIQATCQLSKVEILKIQAQTKSFNKWLLEQRNENKEVRAEIITYAESYRKQIERIIDMILLNPETTSLYKDFFESLLKANNELALRMSEIRIKSK